MSKIEWTGLTWNPVVGCTIHSPGCRCCYAMGEAYRKQFHPNDAIRAKYAGTVEKTKAGQLLWTGKLGFSESALLAPLRRKVPTTWFVNSMSDLFHEDMPEEWIDRIFAVMALCPQHTFQVLTKRADRMRGYLARACGRIADAVMALRRQVGIKSALAPLPHIKPGAAWWPLANVWLGVSVEDQKHADLRVPDLLASPAAIRFLSCEPLLGMVDVGWALGNRLDIAAGFLKRGQFSPGLETLRHLDWVICGGESGKDARPMHPDWARRLRDQCEAAKVPFFFKQWGEWHPSEAIDHPLDCQGRMTMAFRDDHSQEYRPSEANYWVLKPGWQGMCRVGKKAAGRQLDFVEHNELPEREAANG